MNLNNWRNWGTNALISLGFKDQFAHAFAEQDYFVEYTEEEVDLAPTVFELRIGRNWYKPWKWYEPPRRSAPSQPSVDVEKIKEDARKAAEQEAKKIADKQKAAYDKQQAEIKAMKEAEAQRAAAAAAAEQKRKAKLTAGASALKIGGPRDTTGVGKRKEQRKMGTGKTKKTFTPKPALNPAGAAAGVYGGAPVL